MNKKNANINGITFENKTSIENTLIDKNYKKYIINKKNKFGFYYELITDSYKIIYLTQNGFKEYLKKFFNINVYKKPDEAFIIINNNEIIIKILEKKNQNVQGSVEEKLKTGKFNKIEYYKMIKKELKHNNLKNNIKIEYSFCINNYLQEKINKNTMKYNIIKEIMCEDDINIFYGDEKNYFDEVYKWIIN